MLDHWHAHLSFDEAIEFTADWYKESLHSNDMWNYCVHQIEAHGAKK